MFTYEYSSDKNLYRIFLDGMFVGKVEQQSNGFVFYPSGYTVGSIPEPTFEKCWARIID